MALQQCLIAYNNGNPEIIDTVRSIKNREYSVIGEKEMNIGKLLLLKDENGKYLAGLLEDDDVIDLFEELTSDFVYVSPELDECFDAEDNQRCQLFDEIYNVIAMGKFDMECVLMLSKVIVFVNKFNEVLTCKPLITRYEGDDTNYVIDTFTCTAFSYNRLYINDVEFLFNLQSGEIKSKGAYRVHDFYYSYPAEEGFGEPFNYYTAYQISKPLPGGDGEWEVYYNEETAPSIVGIFGIELTDVDYNGNGFIAARKWDGLTELYFIGHNRTITKSVLTLSYNITYVRHRQQNGFIQEIELIQCFDIRRRFRLYTSKGEALDECWYTELKLSKNWENDWDFCAIKSNQTAPKTITDYYKITESGQVIKCKIS